ncbi:MAG: M1 family metallopeptidase [Bacteroidia bacterium]|nr:M1 family metallopeptidase [Bacteroidia bacterium]MDW8014758.1 M1 family metallopeptidase [Bacteroidia bacterium]
MQGCGIVILIILGGGAYLLAQKPYFQQRVEYFIKVRLEPQRHLLHGYLRLRYQNNSPDTLSGLYFHLWPNAYKRRGTPFDRQQRIAGKTRFYFATQAERGFMDSLAFQVDGQAVRPLPAHQGPKPAEGHSQALLRRAPDVVWLPFPKPLPSGQSCLIETPFRVRVPVTFSRMGRSKVQYAITQWYPKPAVYDRHGWHPLPYLDQGEYYSEWGRYEVEIEVPDNFIVAATGILQTPEEIERLRQREEATRTWIAQQSSKDTIRSLRIRRLLFLNLTLAGEAKTPPNLPAWASDTTVSPTYKVLRFTQDSVHDFAWFADPRYGIVSDTMELPNGHKVACVSVFHLPYYQAWQYTPQYIAEAIRKLSQSVGPYPYAHATAVEGGLEAGGGMEYPMITIIIPTTDTSTLRQIVVHEVGHNWFQGLLASNERLSPWQDEGVNTYYEKRILTESPTFTIDPSQRVRAAGAQSATNISLEIAAYHHLNADIALARPSHEHSPLSYALGVYQQTGTVLRSAVFAFTPERWDAAMQRYFQQWAFRHPYPEDWAESLEQEGLPGKGLLRYLRTDAEVDIRLRARRLSDTTYQIRLEEPKKYLPRPFWVEGVAVDKEEFILQDYRLPLDSSLTITVPKETRAFLVNPQLTLYERRVGNNFLYHRRLFPQWRNLRVALGAPLRLPQVHTTYLGLFPALGYNYRDGLIVGLGAYHGLFPKRIGEFHLLPMYSVLRRDLRGSVGFTLRAFPADSRIQLIELRLRSASFAGFWRTKASLEATLRRAYDRFGWRHILRLRTHHLAFQDLENRAYDWVSEGRPAYVALDWEARREEPILTLYGMLSVGHDLQGHARAEAEGRLMWRPLKQWRPWARVYAGWTAEGSPSYLQFRAAGFDPFGEAVLLDRFRESPARFLRQQMVETQGAARFSSDTLTAPALLAVNVEIPLPAFSFIALRADVGYLPSDGRSYWGLSVGLPVIRFRDRFIVGGYFPFLGDAFPDRRPESFQAILRRFVWSIQVPLDLRWALPW